MISPNKRADGREFGHPSRRFKYRSSDASLQTLSEPQSAFELRIVKNG